MLNYEVHFLLVITISTKEINEIEKYDKARILFVRRYFKFKINIEIRCKVGHLILFKEVQ